MSEFVAESKLFLVWSSFSITGWSENVKTRRKNKLILRWAKSSTPLSHWTNVSFFVEKKLDDSNYKLLNRIVPFALRWLRNILYFSVWPGRTLVDTSSWSRKWRWVQRRSYERQCRQWKLKQCTQSKKQYGGWGRIRAPISIQTSLWKHSLSTKEENQQRINHEVKMIK